MLFNTHSHVDTSRQFHADREEVLARAAEAGVSRLMVIGYCKEVLPKTLSFIDRHLGAYAAVGTHPTSALEWCDTVEGEIRGVTSHRNVRAIGEVGLDYYWKDKAPFEVQRDVFREQIRLARELKLPIVVHDRDAHEDVVRILEEEHAEDVGGIMHCFAGDWAIAERCLGMGFYIGVGGTVTYKNNAMGQDLARRVFLDRIVLETDDPYLAPVPFRGKRNEPAYVRYVAEFLAQLRGLSMDEVEDATYKNACAVLKLTD